MFCPCRTPIMSSQLPVFPAQPTLYTLPGFAAIRLTGEERVKYLQGQVTCDVAALTPGQQTLGGHCDPKGKLWSDFRLLTLASALLLVLRRSALARELPELKKFAVFSKVEIVEAPHTLAGLAGSGCDALMADTFGLTGSGLIPGGMAVRLEADRWLLASESLPALTLPEGSEGDWMGFEILAGLPHLEAPHQGEYIPQMINLQALNGISFTKGCYTGQETVARAKYRGANNRALFLLEGNAGREVSAGDTLELRLGENWRRSGMVINVWQEGDALLVSAVLPKDTEVDAEFRLKEDEGSALRLRPLPYELVD
ncbi:tRNA-modifying protein YgfZ [Aeromonas schubertii]|uniref:tRNA-modifying protein YgfZ n=1 Tax=Aeromonas schubertii TaxID=652 RepID=A0ABS7VC36_9GAMM|nr:tRNA-modifying protein YgfZ [Aeromonas schubertii]MBZ6066478.1 tRNA-modifying protein YgfZ [Aeromonas schubertii]